MKAIAFLVAGTATMLVSGALAVAAAGGGTSEGQAPAALVRQATERFHDVEAALAAGYVPTEHCLSVPGLGTMGYHYVNPGLIFRPGVELDEPEVLLYVPRPDAGLRLVAVEWLAVDGDQNVATDAERPSLAGIPFDGPMLGHEPGMPIHYDLHAWVWQANPNGLFAPFNPNVRC